MYGAEKKKTTAEENPNTKVLALQVNKIEKKKKKTR